MMEHAAEKMADERFQCRASMAIFDAAPRRLRDQMNEDGPEAGEANAWCELFWDANHQKVLDYAARD